MFSPKGFTLLLCQNGGFGGQIYLQGDGWQVREEATRDLPSLELFKQLEYKFFVNVKVVLSTLADVQFSYIQFLKRPVRRKISEDMY